MPAENILSTVDEANLIYAQTEYITIIHHLLKSVAFKTCATIFFSTNGVRIVVEDGIALQANAYIPKNLFLTYKLDKDVKFRLNLDLLLNVLQTFKSNGSSSLSHSKLPSSHNLTFKYSQMGGNLYVIIDEEDMKTRCSFKTINGEEILSFNTIETNLRNKFIMKSEVLKDIFKDFDSSYDILEMSVSQNTPNITFTMFGDLGSMNIEFSQTSSCVEYASIKEDIKLRFKISILKPVFKALMYSSKVSLSIYSNGCVSWQHMIKQRENFDLPCFIEYFCVALDDYDL